MFRRPKKDHRNMFRPSKIPQTIDKCLQVMRSYFIRDETKVEIEDKIEYKDIVEYKGMVKYIVEYKGMDKIEYKDIVEYKDMVKYIVEYKDKLKLEDKLDEINYSSGLGYSTPDFLFDVYTKNIPKSVENVLDVGSGNGAVVTESMPEYVRNIYCSEPWKVRYPELQETIRSQRLPERYHITDLSIEDVALRLRNGEASFEDVATHPPIGWPTKFDCITISKWCINYDKRQQALDSCYKLLSQNGRLIITCVERYLAQKVDEYKELYLPPLITKAGFILVEKYLYQNGDGGCWVLVCEKSD
jgi:SAM-dependent methyltransferase